MRIVAALILSSISVLGCFERSAIAGDISKETAFKEASYVINTDLPLCRYVARQPSNDVGDSAGSSLQRGSPDEVKKKLVADGSSSLPGISPPDELKKRTEAALETYQKSIADYRLTTQPDPLCSRIFSPHFEKNLIAHVNNDILPGCEIVLGDLSKPDLSKPPKQLIFDCDSATVKEEKEDGTLFRYTTKTKSPIFCHRYKLNINSAGYLTSIEHFGGVIQNGICNPDEAQNGPLLEKIYFQRVGDTCIPDRASVFVQGREVEVASINACRRAEASVKIMAIQNAPLGTCLKPPPEIREDEAFLKLCRLATDSFHKILSEAQANAAERKIDSCYACPSLAFTNPTKTDAEREAIYALNKTLPDINAQPKKVEEILTIGDDFTAKCTQYYGWTPALQRMYFERVIEPQREKEKAEAAAATHGQ